MNHCQSSLKFTLAVTHVCHAAIAARGAAAVIPARKNSKPWKEHTAGAAVRNDGRTAGFHLSSLYSPWETWAEIAQEHARVAKDPARLQVWVNTKLGESWEDQAGDTVPADPLMARREDWGSDLAPGVAVLTAGVDVQGDRLEVQVIDWGRDEEAYRCIRWPTSGGRRTGP